MLTAFKQVGFLIFVFCLLSVFAFNCEARPKKIVGMRAMLFYQNTGTFSADVFTAQSDLWNVAFDYVYSTFVMVEVEGDNEREDYVRQRKIEFVARYIPLDGKREITVRKVSPLWFDENGKAFMGFWIDKIGCDPIKISANINGQKTRMRKEINFQCGE